MILQANIAVGAGTAGNKGLDDWHQSDGHQTAGKSIVVEVHTTVDHAHIEGHG